MKGISQYLNIFFTFLSVLLLLVPAASAAWIADRGVDTVPQYSKLKELSVEIALVKKGKAASAIVIPADQTYFPEAVNLQDAVWEKTGMRIPIYKDSDTASAFPLKQNLILLGNRSTNTVISKLYDFFYCLTDLKYPGPGGYELRSVHHPLGSPYSVILVGGSDRDGVTSASSELVRMLDRQRTNDGDLSLGWLKQIQLANDVALPEKGAVHMPTWQGNKGYGLSTGYFGWNSVSKNMALYYMTGDEKYAQEFLRLAFPDEKAILEMTEFDGEAVENKEDPLAGPYHYNATRMVLYWDLIEESPFFSDQQRLKITNALARQYTHVVAGTPDSDWLKRVAMLEEPQPTISSRHHSLTAMQLYVLARYFRQYDPGPFWDKLYRSSGEFYFAALSQPEPMVAGELDNLFWYNTAIAPILDYIIISGDHRAVENGALAYLLNHQEILWNGKDDDRHALFTAADYLAKAAYLTGDNRWLYYLKKYTADTSTFRLDQSFWPDNLSLARAPEDLNGVWNVWKQHPDLLKIRRPVIPADEAFANMSYRSQPGNEGDFMLLDGMNGEARNPYHSFALLNLRISGKTLLDGYLNQVRTSADGTVEPTVAKDAALTKKIVLGQTVLASAEVPNLPYASWQRSWLLRKNRYAIAADQLVFRNNSNHFEAEFWWQGGDWKSDGWNLQDGGACVVSAEPLYPVINKNQARLVWHQSVRKGEQRQFFTVVAAEKPGERFSGLRLSANAAVFRVPETIIVSAGIYLDVNADLAVQSERYFFASNLMYAPEVRASAPVDLDWDYQSGLIHIENDVAVEIYLTGQQRKYRFKPGKHVIRNAYPGTPIALGNKEKLLERSVQKVPEASPHQVPVGLPAMDVVQTFDAGEEISQTLYVDGPAARKYYIHTAHTIYELNENGTLVRKIDSEVPVKVIHWWADANLLILGKLDQTVWAYSHTGKLQWTFRSELDPGVFAAGKQYWFNTAPGHQGIHGLHSGRFLANQSQLFVGSACTLELVDKNGKLIRRLPQFWGPPSLFRLIPGPSGAVRLLSARSITERANLTILDNMHPDPHRRAFNRAPEHFSQVSGWMDQRHQRILYQDVDNDGEKDVISDVAGVWNRVAVWDTAGNAKYAIYFGAGPSPYGNAGKLVPTLIRGMDAGDIDGDGQPELVAALSTGLIVVMNGRCEIKWSVRTDHPPTALKIHNGNILIGDEDGSVYMLQAQKFVLKGNVRHPVSDIIPRPGTGIVVVAANQLHFVSGPKL